MNETAIFGGSFDPIHLVHLKIIKLLIDEFDKVLILPNYLSPFKNKSENIDNRLKMINLALKDFNLINNKKISIELFEANKNKKCYTYDTIIYLNKKYSNTNFHFVIGGDMVANLTKWYNFDLLKNIVSFFVIGRKNFKYKYSNNLLNCDINFSKYEFEDISSSLVKVAKSFNKINYYVTEDVAKFICDNNIYNYYDKYYSALLGINHEREEHIFRTVKCAITLAKLYNIEVEKAIIAGILHDCAKNNNNYNYLIDENIKKIVPSVRHAAIAAKVAKYVCKINDEDIINAIDNHTTGRKKMSDLEKIIFLADFIEEERKIPQLIRDTAYSSLDLAMKLALEFTIDKLQGQALDKRTIEAYEYYSNIKNF